MLKELRTFLSRDNVVQLATAVIVGGAFSKIVQSLVDDIFMPVIVAITGQADVTGIAIQLGSTTIGIGNFLQAVINFVLIGSCIFFTLKTLGAAQGKDLINPPAKPAGPSEKDLLKDILEELKKK